MAQSNVVQFETSARRRRRRSGGMPPTVMRVQALRDVFFALAQYQPKTDQNPPFLDLIDGLWEDDDALAALATALGVPVTLLQVLRQETTYAPSYRDILALQAWMDCEKIQPEDIVGDDGEEA